MTLLLRILQKVFIPHTPTKQGAVVGVTTNKKRPMSDNLNITATFTASDGMSPVIQKLLDNLKKFENAAKRINASLSGMGSAGIASISNFDRVTQAAAASMGGFASANRSASKSVAAGWRQASEQRLRDARGTYASLERMEASYQRQLRSRPSAGARPPSPGGGGSPFRGYGSVPRLPAPSIRSLALAGTVAGAGIGSAIKKRMEVDAAETRAAMFGEMSKENISSLRRSFADRAGIKYGVGTGKVIDAATEGLKAGIAKQYAGEFADLALKAQAGLDVSSTDTAKLMGRLSTQMPWDRGRFNQVLNAVAVANNETAADGSEIIEGMRRSLSALATTKMTPEQLAGLNATGISLGIQPGKTGTFLSFLTSQIAGAGSSHGQQAKDLGSAAGALGFGSRGAMAQVMRDSPVEAIQQILDNLAQMPEALRTKVAKQIGGREWMDELLTVVLGRDKLSDVLKQIDAKPGFLDKTALTKINSMSGRWASISAAFGLVWEKIGGGFEEIFDQITESIIDLAGSFSFETIKQHVSALTTGLREGFGLKSWGDAIRALASSLSAGSVAKWREFGTGFAQGIGSFITTIKGAFTGLASITGSGDAASMGKLAAQIVGLSVALALLSPILGVLASLTAFIGAVAIIASSATLGIGALFVALSVGLKMSLSYVSDKIFSVFVGIVDAVQSVALGVINKVRGWIGLSPIGGGKAPSTNKPRTGSLGASGSWTDELAGPSGDSKEQPAKKISLEMKRLGERFEKVGDLIQKASLSGVTGLASSSLTTGGSSAGESFSSGSNVGALMTSTPGQALPDFGASSRGIIGRGTGGLDKGKFESTFENTSLAGKYDQIVAAAKANGIDPALLAGIMAQETGRGRNVSGNNPGGIMDSANGWKTKKQFGSLNEGIDGTAKIVAKNYAKAGGDIGKLASIYAPVGAGNDPGGLNRHWPGNVTKFRSEMAVGGNGGAGAIAGVPNGIADQLGVRGGANMMKGQFGAAGSNLTGIKTPGGKSAQVHSAAAESFQGFVNELEASGYKIKSFGGHNHRGKRGGGGLSQHAYGNAIDINPEQNPFGNKLITDMPQNIREIAAKWGLSWGGDWKSVKDAMHFEWMGKQPWKDGTVPGAPATAGGVPPAPGVTSAVPGVTSKVPLPTGVTQASYSGGGMGGGNSGPVAININGGSHDAEGLANLVQKRMNEAMNARNHDFDAESV